MVKESLPQQPEIKNNSSEIKTAPRPSFCGFFIDPDELAAKLPQKTSLQMEVRTPHITTSYFPDSSNIDNFVARPELYEETAKIKVIGYGNNGKNEGLSVAIESNNPEMSNIIHQKDRIYHITLSYSPDSAPVNTKNLEFQPLEEPFYLSGTYDISSNNIIFDKEKNETFNELD